MLPKLTFLDDEPFLFDLVNGSRVLKMTPSQQQNKSIREKLRSDWELVTERIKAFDLEEQLAAGEQTRDHYTVFLSWADTLFYRFGLDLRVRIGNIYQKLLIACEIAQLLRNRAF